MSCYEKTQHFSFHVLLVRLHVSNPSHLNTSTIPRVKDCLLSLSIHPFVLNACSEEIDNTGMLNTSQASCESIENLLACVFHQRKISKSLSSLGSRREKSISRYLLSSAYWFGYVLSLWVWVVLDMDDDSLEEPPSVVKNFQDFFFGWVWFCRVTWSLSPTNLFS